MKPLLTGAHTVKNLLEALVVHTCWLIITFWMYSTLSIRDTTAWFGAMARWQFFASVTGFRVSSRHSSSKSSSLKFLAHSCVFFPGDRKVSLATANLLGQGILSALVWLFWKTHMARYIIYSSMWYAGDDMELDPAQAMRTTSMRSISA